MLENLDKYHIVLASNSPRRRELLSGLGINYEVRVIKGIDETYPSILVGEEIPLYISHLKASAYMPLSDKNELLITADTIVLNEGCVLGKPADSDSARTMLKQLSGHKHEVITGVTITTTKIQKSFAVSTKVSFCNLSDDEINYYVENFNPIDKAGAYGIQEWIGFVGVDSIEGSYFNVMGLPVQRLYRELKDIQ
jgi:septum formation protein